MPSRKNEAAELATRLVGVLETHRGQSGDAYPPSLVGLIALAKPALPELVPQAIRHKAFTERAIVSLKDNPAAPVALVEDSDALAASPVLLELLLESVCSPDSPACLLNKLTTRLDRRLKVPFTASVRSRIESNTLPAGVGHIRKGKSVRLYLQRYGRPRKPEEALAEKLLEALKAARDAGDGYPVLWQKLLAQVEPAGDATLRKKALAQPMWKGSVLFAATRPGPTTPVALAEDAERLAGSWQVLEFALHAARTATDQVFAVAPLKAKLAPKLRPAFVAALERRIADGTLPAGVGWVLSKKKPLLFLVEDLHLSAPLEALHAPSQPVQSAPVRNEVAESSFDFPAAFDEAFQRLDRQAGSLNFVSLVALRRAIPVERAVFDRELRQLRLAGRYALSAAEGRHGISPEEREAAIPEEGSLLLFVSRKSP